MGRSFRSLNKQRRSDSSNNTFLLFCFKNYFVIFYGSDQCQEHWCSKAFADLSVGISESKGLLVRQTPPSSPNHKHTHSFMKYDKYAKINALICAQNNGFHIDLSFDSWLKITKIAGTRIRSRLSALLRVISEEWSNRRHGWTAVLIKSRK